MKKFISVFLSALLVFSAASVTAFAAEDTLEITIVNDLHLDLKDVSASEVAKRNSISEIYAHASSSGQLPYESLAIIKGFLRDAAKGSSDIILMPGDLTTIGDEAEHLAFIALIKAFEEETGKKVFVVPGNHDLFNTDVSGFEALYADFGYNEAIANDPATASYVAELGNGYRLLAIDSTIPGDSYHGVDAELEAWVKAQCEAAEKDGKKLIAMMHHNLLEHFEFVRIFHKGSVVTEQSMSFADTLADGGVKYIFTGHTHDQDIAKYTSAAGNVIYDCVTASINAYPCPYRTVSLGEKVKIETKYVRSVDTTLFPAGIHSEAMALAESNFLKYAKNCTYIGVQLSIRGYMNPAALKRTLNIQDEQLKAVIEPVIDKLCEALLLPIYKADEEAEGKSLQSMGEAIKVEIPESSYKNMAELGVTFYQAHVEGDENIPAYSDDMVILQRTFAIILNYALSDLGAAEYAMALNYVVGLLGVNISDEILGTVGGALEKFKGNELLLATALVPFISGFTTDEAPADNNVTLPGYGNEAEEEEDFLTKIRSFFKKIFDFFHSLFALFA